MREVMTRYIEPFLFVIHEIREALRVMYSRKDQRDVVSPVEKLKIERSEVKRKYSNADTYLVGISNGDTY